MVVSGFNTTLTAKVISWRSMTRMCVSWLSHTSTNTTFLSKATDYFSHMLLLTPERKVASTGDRTHNHKVMSPTCSSLSHPGGGPWQGTPDQTIIQVKTYINNLIGYYLTLYPRTNFKAFADNIFHVVQIMFYVSDRVENIVGKGENALNRRQFW